MRTQVPTQKKSLEQENTGRSMISDQRTSTQVQLQQQERMANSPQHQSLNAMQLKMDAANSTAKPAQLMPTADFIKKLTEYRHILNPIEIERLIYHNDKNDYKADSREVVEGGWPYFLREESKKVIPEREDRAGANPPWWAKHNGFTVQLPSELGGSTLSFLKQRERRVLAKNAGWISNNALFKPDSGNTLMIHVIIHFDDEGENPNPHITVRDAATQALITLDEQAPRKSKDGGKRVTGELDATKTSYSRGLGTTARSVGDALRLSETTKTVIDSEAIKTWLETTVTGAANAAKIAQD